MKEPTNRNYIKQSKEEQTQIVDNIEEGKANDVDSEKPTTEPITEPDILKKPEYWFSRTEQGRAC